MIAGALLLAIAVPTPNLTVRGETSQTCAAGPAKALVCRRRSAATERAALRASGAGLIRWIGVGQMVTMDYRPDRLDLRLDRRSRIIAVSCG